MSTNLSRRKPLFRSLSIQQRLPLLICTLLLTVIISFSWISYMGVKKASIKVGHERLSTLANQLSSMFGQSSRNFINASRVAAAHDTIKGFLLSGGTNLRSESIAAMKKLQVDSLAVLVELFDKTKSSILQSGVPGVSIKADFASILDKLSLQPDSAKIGKIFISGDSMFYPVVAAVTDKKQIIGYLVRWRLLHATPQAIDQFSKLIGLNSVLLVGNNDGSLWTDMVKPVPGPKYDTSGSTNFFEFSKANSGQIIGTTQNIPNSPWKVLIGFPKVTIMESSNKFLGTTIIIGGILIIIAMFVAWLMSRNITRPLKKLTAASSSIAAGDYSATVPIERRDELGKLARAFNAMTVQVHTAQTDLERKVQERTTQLLESNKELEAFSYSVSHDLRAPLRAISGFAVILKEEYGTKLDNEAHRITNKIISNAEMMALLIDSLISFSQLGAAEMTSQPVDMNILAETSLWELLQHEPPDKYQVEIKPLSNCQGDPTLIKQVWINLISNAIKYSSKISKPKIEIGCTEGSEMNIYYIKDNGSGFDMNYAHKLFGVFQRLHSQKDFEGTGIGLAFTKRIILKHKGDIWAESLPGEGASFYFSLPVSKMNKISQREVRLTTQPI